MLRTVSVTITMHFGDLNPSYGICGGEMVNHTIRASEASWVFPYFHVQTSMTWKHAPLGKQTIGKSQLEENVILELILPGR